MSQLSFLEIPAAQKPEIVEMVRQINPYHLGLSKHPLKSRWWGMWNRCTNPNQENYRDYGARGIRVCEEWAAYIDGEPAPGFIQFLDDMGESWMGPGYDLDRIDPNGDYCKQNCRWIRKSENIARANRTRIGTRYRRGYRA